MSAFPLPSSSSAPRLPMIIMFERPWDQTPRKLLQRLLPELAGEGYDTFCVQRNHGKTVETILKENDQDIANGESAKQTIETILKALKVKVIDDLSDLGVEKLKRVLEQYGILQLPPSLSEQIKHLPSHYLFRTNIQIAQEHSLEVCPVDFNYSDFEQIASNEFTSMDQMASMMETERMKIMANHLVKLYRERSGLIFTFGALYSQDLLKQLYEYGLKDEIIYFFPHSSQRFDQGVDDAKEFVKGLLAGHSHRIDLDEEAICFTDSIVKKVTECNRHYSGHPTTQNSQAEYLSEMFNAEFKTFIRSGINADLLIDIEATPNAEEIAKKLREFGIIVHKKYMAGHDYYMIPNVNTATFEKKLSQLRVG